MVLLPLYHEGNYFMRLHLVLWGKVTPEEKVRSEVLPWRQMIHVIPAFPGVFKVCDLDGAETPHDHGCHKCAGYYIRYWVMWTRPAPDVAPGEMDKVTTAPSPDLQMSCNTALSCPTHVKVLLFCEDLWRLKSPKRWYRKKDVTEMGESSANSTERCLRVFCISSAV